jgi:hypothetical protein
MKFTPDWGGQLVRALEQNLLDTAPATQTNALYQFNFGQFTLQTVLPFVNLIVWRPATQGLNVKMTMAGNMTFSLDGTGLNTGALVTLLLTIDATGGYIFGWGGANIKWSGGAAFAPTMTANKQNLVTFYWDGFFFNEYVKVANL